jgi:hypothetical protein
MSLIKLASKDMEQAAERLKNAVPTFVPMKAKSFLNRHKGKMLLGIGGLTGLGIGTHLYHKERKK